MNMILVTDFKKHWGKGYATESAIASMDYGQNTLGIKRIVGRARIENSASIGVFSKLNMHYVEDFEEDGQHWVLYAVEKSS